MEVASGDLVPVEELLSPSVEAMGFQLVQLRWIGSDTGKRTLQVMADRLDREEMTVDDCADISRAVSALLDVEDPVDGAYFLEVSTPGLERPLVRMEDFDRFSGMVARIEMKRLIAGQRKFRGLLGGTRSAMVLISVDTDQGGKRVVELPYAEIEKAKLVLTEELIQESLKKQRKTAK